MHSVRHVCACTKRWVAGPMAWFVWSLPMFGPGPVLQAAQEPRRYPIEEDAIRMVRIAGRGSINNYAGALTEDFAYFSPNREQFVLVLKKGNLDRNTNDYSLLLFKTNEAFQTPKPRILVSMSSSSNREAITDVAWLPDNETILFRGENPGETTQLYSVSAKSGTVRRRTNHPTNIIRFSADASGQTIVFVAEKPAARLLTDQTAREGVAVSNEDMSELVLGERAELSRELFVLNSKTGESHLVPVAPELHGQLYGDNVSFSLSPKGGQVVASLNLSEVPESWREYREPLFARILKRELPKGSLTWMFRYAVFDTESGRGRILLDAPVGGGSQVIWGQDEQRLILTGVFLPIDDARGNPRRLANPAVVEIDLKTLKYTILSEEDLRFFRRVGDGGVLAFETRRRPPAPATPDLRFFRDDGSHWVPAEALPAEPPTLTVAAQQDLNTPPRIVVSDSRTGREAVLLDPNPQLGEIDFGKVEEIRFLGAGHREVHAGLYFPPGYIPGKRYPLVLQTHGFDPKSFWIDGSFTTAFAAQALAGRGFLVLQVPDRHDWDETPAEAPNMADTLERAVEYVDGLGCLDRDHLGITGFSRTGLYAYYLLTHSKLHFGAAVVADGSDGGYSQYLQFLNAHSFTASDSELLNGATPFGSGLLYWLRRSAEFSLDTVDTPLLLQVSAPENVGSMWAPFVGLKRLGKPVELLYFPAGAHIRERPWDRLASQGGAVDWFAFWLKGEEDPDPAKAQKYKRWRELRNLEKTGTHVF